MVYTLFQGAQNHNDRLHYSLYGAVEYLPDNTLAFKELLPLAAIPAIAITLLVALLNFNIPKLSPQAGAKGGSSVTKTPITSISLSNGNGSSNHGSTGTPFSSNASSSTGQTNINPSGTDNGQGIIGGRGGDGGSTTIPPTPVPNPTTAISANTPVLNASISTNATSQTTNSQTMVNANVPATGTTVGLTL